ncbi:hypothetical protein GH811_05515 [Acetobacterium malicum]|uniref:Uncharacterized protein n=1 Tax=Acetobacterium malicum TaxID=52692 RepID=A0ABR6YV97_9FIRM|nr:hypothetical protein [Acetobacterium malicum]MBC3899071.1 hypothetical protein [Acetobacterium malicum]
MEQLITIETVPIKIEYVKKEPLSLSSVHDQNAKVDSQVASQRIESKPIRIALNDSFEPSTDYQWDNSTYTATANYGEDGKFNLKVQMEDGQAKPIHFKHLSRGINQMVGMMSHESINSIGESPSMIIPIDSSSISSGMKTSDNANIEFMPPDIELKITQRPQVIIKYVGGPIYVPRSADPNYQPIVGFETSPVVAEGFKLDQKA